MGVGGNKRVALVFRGERSARTSTTLENSRLAPIGDALAELGISAVPVIYDDEWADDVRQQLGDVDGVLVWVDPVTGAQDRSVLDALLRDVARSGVWVSAHPDVILKMGTKEVLFSTRELGWGSDVALYRSPAEFEAGFPGRLATGPRVLKQNRGNGGIGVWKAELADPTALPEPDAVVTVQSARLRDDAFEQVALGAFMKRCAKYFGYAEGRLIDQPFQARISEGMIRCYLVGNEVVGFSRQFAPGRSPDDRAASRATAPARVFGLPSAKTMFAPDQPAFESLRARVEGDWVPAMQRLVEVTTDALPALWDADFLFGPKDSRGEDTFVLSEINVSAVAPFPPQAVPTLARAVQRSLGSEVAAGD